MNDLDLISQICSRLCHDLVGPIGAVGNGVEVLSEEDDEEMRRQAVDLLAYSAEQATVRLKFYRLAFGASGGEGVPISLSEARQATVDLLAESRVEMNWPDEAAGAELPLGKAGVKILLNAILMIAESMPRGGSLEVGINADGDNVVVKVEGQGTGARMADAAAVAIATGKSTDDIPPKLSPASLISRLAAAAGGRLDLAQGEDRIRFEAVVPISR